MYYIEIFTSLIFLVSSSKFSDAVLPTYCQNPVEVREIFISRNFTIPGEPVVPLPKLYLLTAYPASIYICNDTRMDSFAIARDNRRVHLLSFFSRQLQFDFMAADHIKFDMRIQDDEILTLFCVFPTISHARRFFQMVRGNVSNYEPQNLVITRVETYDEYEHSRELLIPRSTFLRQNFIHDRNAADSVEFELRWNRADNPNQPVSVKFVPYEYYVSNVVNGTEVMLISGEEKYIMHFELPDTAQQFFEYTLRFASGQLEISDDFRIIVKPR